MELNKKITVVMATYNSESTVEMALRALRDQDYPQQLVEILMVDGGSKDRTREIGLRYGCKIVENPRVEPISAKLIGLTAASGDYLLTCDSDEITESPMALRKRCAAMAADPDVHLVLPSGYKDPQGAGFLTKFINEYGDPFSMFFYRLTKGHEVFPATLKRWMRVKKETADFIVFQIPKGGRQPIIENGAMGSLMDLKFFRENFSGLIATNPHGAVHLFFYQMQTHTDRFAVTLGDPLVHYSTVDWKTYLRKIHWRVVNNLFYAKDMGNAGFNGRQAYDSGFVRVWKYLFIPYSLLLFPVIVDSIVMSIRRRDIRFLGASVLCVYTASLIVGYSALKIFGFRPRVKGYGNVAVAKGHVPGMEDIARSN